MILIVFLDGLRPDQVTAEHTPNITHLIREGVYFQNHHAVFPTETRVNVASFVTGRNPGFHGIVGNTFRVNDDEASWEVDTGKHQCLAKLNSETGGRMLLAKSIGEILAENSEKMVAIGVGSGGNAFLNNHKAEKNRGVVIHPEFTIPEKEEKEITNNVGAWPLAGTPNIGRIHYATSILLDYVIPEHDPIVVSLWFSEPDGAQHKTHISSNEALKGIEQADAEIGRIIKYLKDRGLDDSTDLLVASDHGHSTVGQTIDIAEQLVLAGLKEEKDSMDLKVSSTGGCALIYVNNHEEAKIRAVSEYLIAQEWCGSLFSSSNIPGTFPVPMIHDKTSRSPDILLSYQWSDGVNIEGMKGTAVFAKGAVPVGAGSHGSISPYEIRNLLIAMGPNFKKGICDQTPSGTVDITPTILHILGIKSSLAFDGRVLSEALLGGPEPENIPFETRSTNTSKIARGQTITQELRTSRVGSTEYLDWGLVRRLRGI